MSIFVQYAPYHLNGGWTDAKREAFGDTVINTLARYAPNIESLILASAGADAGGHRAHHRASEGNIFPGELALHQLFFLRPAPPGRSTARRSGLLAMRRGNASGRRHHGRVRPAGRAGDPGKERAHERSRLRRDRHRRAARTDSSPRPRWRGPAPRAAARARRALGGRRGRRVRSWVPRAPLGSIPAGCRPPIARDLGSRRSSARRRRRRCPVATTGACSSRCLATRARRRAPSASSRARRGASGRRSRRGSRTLAGFLERALSDARARHRRDVARRAAAAARHRAASSARSAART